MSSTGAASSTITVAAPISHGSGRPATRRAQRSAPGLVEEGEPWFRWSRDEVPSRDPVSLLAALRARRTARGSIQRWVSAKSAGTSSRAVTMTATTVIAVANPKAPKVDRPDRRRPSSETSTVVAGQDDRRDQQ